MIRVVPLFLIREFFLSFSCFFYVCFFILCVKYVYSNFYFVILFYFWAGARPQARQPFRALSELPFFPVFLINVRRAEVLRHRQGQCGKRVGKEPPSGTSSSLIICIRMPFTTQTLCRVITSSCTDPSQHRITPHTKTAM